MKKTAEWMGPKKINSFQDLWTAKWETSLRFKVMRKKYTFKKKKNILDGENKGRSGHQMEKRCKQRSPEVISRQQ